MKHIFLAAAFCLHCVVTGAQPTTGSLVKEVPDSVVRASIEAAAKLVQRIADSLEQDLLTRYKKDLAGKWKDVNDSSHVFLFIQDSLCIEQTRQGEKVYHYSLEWVKPKNTPHAIAIQLYTPAGQQKNYFITTLEEGRILGLSNRISLVSDAGLFRWSRFPDPLKYH